MITWNINVAGLDRTALVRPGSTGAKLGILALHGHGQAASVFQSKFTAKQDVVHVFLQGLPADDDSTDWIRPDSATYKYTRYNAQGTEDYDYVEAVLEKAKAEYPLVQAWVAIGFSGGAALLRYLAHDRLFPFDAWGLCGNSVSTEHVTGGKFESFGGLPPLFFHWGLRDESYIDQPNMVDFGAATDIWAATYAATQTSTKSVTVCGKTYEQRWYSNPALTTYVGRIGHEMINCPTDGTDDRFERFVRARLGL